MVGVKQGQVVCRILWLEVSKGMLYVECVVGSKQGHAVCRMLWLEVSKGMLYVEY